VGVPLRVGLVGLRPKPLRVLAIPRPSLTHPDSSGGLLIDFRSGTRLRFRAMMRSQWLSALSSGSRRTRPLAIPGATGAKRERVPWPTRKSHIGRHQVQQRDDVSETILAAMSVFTFLLLLVCPGGFLWFLLPHPFGVIAALCCGAIGPALLWKVDRDLYGERRQ
jgi:hypothetical protein